jgi:hypothetical protein
LSSSKKTKTLKHPIAYASRKLKGGENNYITTELEMSTVVFLTNHFREYLLGRKITVYSDLSSLQYYQSMKNPLSRITKFIFKLLEYDFEIKHHPGSWNTVADCFLRYPVNITKISDILEDDDDKGNSDKIDFDAIQLNTLRTLQSKDVYCKNII